MLKIKTQNVSGDLRNEKELNRREYEELLRKCSPGSVVELGQYYISNDRNRENLKWRVLERENDRALIITEKAIDCQPYHKIRESVTWEDCTLRKWLNSEFLGGAFNSEEQGRIITAELKSSTGAGSCDTVFLLSAEEAEKYFHSDEDRMCEVTQYARNKGADVYPKNEMFGYWWLRNQGDSSDCNAVYVLHDGYIYNYGGDVCSRSGVVRPAIWFNLES